MKSLSATLALVALVHAGLRFPCSTLTFQRLDPAGQPGAFPSAHLHHIVGGNAFNATMNGDVASRASCTTCQMAEDFSNYWTAVLYFKDPKNGTYHRVSPMPVQPLLGGSQGASGGLTVYYTQFDLSRDNLKQQPIKAFPKGFRMTVGKPDAQSKNHAGLSYQCMNGGNRGTIINNFPTSACTGGDTTKFNSMWVSGAPNPFVWSFEMSGFGTHADYMFGWKDDSLQKAMDKSECFYDGCGSIKKQQMSVANQCTVKDFVGEETVGWLTAPPGQGAGDINMKK